jgi:prepilin-type N-terminal cleavage/methylation domain-containing protein
MKRAFTLIEMVIAVGLLSVIMLFLYQMTANLERNNRHYIAYVDDAEHEQRIVQTLYLDLVRSENNSTTVIPVERAYDQLFTQSANSVYRRIMPYIAYRISDRVLYRIESSRPITPFTRPEEELVIDELGPVERFRVYVNGRYALVDLQLLDRRSRLFKVPLYANMSQ